LFGNVGGVLVRRARLVCHYELSTFLIDRALLHDIDDKGSSSGIHHDHGRHTAGTTADRRSGC